MKKNFLKGEISPIYSIAIMICVTLVSGSLAGFIFHQNYKDVEVTITSTTSTEQELFKEKEPTIELDEKVLEDIPLPNPLDNDSMKEFQKVIDDLENQINQAGGDNIEASD